MILIASPLGGKLNLKYSPDLLPKFDRSMLLLDLMECLACQITHVISASFYGVEFTDKLLLNNRFDNKIKDPRIASKGKGVSKIIKDFLKIKCPINEAASELNKFFKKNRNLGS